MEKQVFQFENFLADVPPDCKEFAAKIHESLLGDGYKCKIESKASGFFVSYSHPQTRRSLLNFLFRKQGLLLRLYADHAGQYADFLNGLPEEMEREIKKAPVCKRLLNPADCNPKCVAGYDFFVGENHYQKCRYGCFQFAVNARSIPVLTEFVELERNCRVGVPSPTG